MLLLDTHIWIWWINQEPNRLPSQIISLIEEAETVVISAISCFEVSWLAEHGRILLKIPVQEWMKKATEGAGIFSLPVSCETAALAAELPEHHKDPQDRIIISTAILQPSRLISADQQFLKYEEIRDILVTF